MTTKTRVGADDNWRTYRCMCGVTFKVRVPNNLPIVRCPGCGVLVCMAPG